MSKTMSSLAQSPLHQSSSRLLTFHLRINQPYTQTSNMESLHNISGSLSRATEEPIPRRVDADLCVSACALRVGLIQIASLYSSF